MPLRTPAAPLLVAVLSMMAGSAAASAADAGTLSDAVALAYQTNPTLLAQRESLKALDESYVQARASLGPQLGLNSQLSSVQAKVEQPSNIFSPASNLRAHARTDSEGLSLSQTLYDGGQSGAAISAAEAEILSGREQLRAAEIQILQRVINAYLAVRRDEALLAIARNAVELLNAEKLETEARFKVHEVTVTDRAQASARLDAARAAFALAQARLDVSRTQYLQVVGANPDSLAPPPTLPALPGSVDAAFDLAERLNPGLGASRYTERSSRAQIDEEKAAKNISLSARVDFQNAPLNTYDSRYYYSTTTARLVLTKPLYTSGSLDSKIRAAIDRNNRDRLAIEQARRDAIQAVGQAWSEMLASDVVLAAQKRQVEAQTLAYDSVRTELKAGLRTTIEVLNAEQELQSARQAVVQAESDSYAARIAVLAAAGALDVQSFAPGIAPYRPERAFRAVANTGLPPLVGAPLVNALEAINSIGVHRPDAAEVRNGAGDARPIIGAAEAAPQTPSPRETARPLPSGP